MAFRRLLLRKSAYPHIRSIYWPPETLTPTNKTAVVTTPLALISTDTTAMNTAAPVPVVTGHLSIDRSLKRERESPGAWPSEELFVSDETPYTGQGVDDSNLPNTPKMTINDNEAAAATVRISPNAAGTPIAMEGTTTALSEIQSATPMRTHHPSRQDRLGDPTEVIRTIEPSTPTQNDYKHTPRVDSAVGLDSHESPSLAQDGSSKRRRSQRGMRTTNVNIQSTPSASNMMRGHTAPKSTTKRDIANTNRKHLGHILPFRRTVETAEQNQSIEHILKLNAGRNDYIRGQLTTTNLFSMAQQRRMLDDAATSNHSTSLAQLAAAEQEMEAVKIKESTTLAEVERLKILLLEANKQQGQAANKHNAEIAALKNQNADLEYIVQLNKNEAGKWKKDAEAAEHRLQQAEVDRMAEVEQLKQKVADSEHVQQNGAYQYVIDLEQLRGQAHAAHIAVVSELQQQLFEVTQQRDEFARPYAAHNTVVNELQQQILEVTQDRDIISRRMVAEGSQLQLLRSLPNFWSLLHEAEVLSCPVKNKLLQNPSLHRNCQGLSLPMADLQSQELEPEDMDGVEQPLIPAGTTLVTTHQTNSPIFYDQSPDTDSSATAGNEGYTEAGSIGSDHVLPQDPNNMGTNGHSDATGHHWPHNGHPPAGFFAPTGPRSQIQQVCLFANGPAANTNATDRRSAQLINPLGFFGNFFHGYGVAEQARGIKQNMHANSQSKPACESLEKGESRSGDYCKFSQMDQDLVQQSIRSPPVSLRIDQTSQGSPSASADPHNERFSETLAVSPKSANIQSKKTCYNLLEDYCDIIIEKDMPEISSPSWAKDLERLVAKCEKVPQVPTPEDISRLRTTVIQLREWRASIEGFPAALTEAINTFKDMVEFFTVFEKNWEQETEAPSSARTSIPKTDLATCWSSLEDLLYNMVEANSPRNPKWAPALEKALEACYCSKVLPTLEDLCSIEIANPIVLRWALNATVPNGLNIQLREIGNIIDHMKVTLGYIEEDEEEDGLETVMEMKGS